MNSEQRQKLDTVLDYITEQSRHAGLITSFSEAASGEQRVLRMYAGPEKGRSILVPMTMFQTRMMRDIFGFANVRLSASDSFSNENLMLDVFMDEAILSRAFERVKECRKVAAFDPDETFPGAISAEVLHTSYE